MPVALDKAMLYMNYVFTVYFLAEMLLKLMGLGFRAYTMDDMNVFDGVVTIAGVVDMGISLSPLAGTMPGRDP